MITKRILLLWCKLRGALLLALAGGKPVILNVRMRFLAQDGEHTADISGCTWAVIAHNDIDPPDGMMLMLMNIIGSQATVATSRE